MNTKWALCLLFLLIFSSVQAQDKIITINGETIECRIVSISDGSITYEQSAPNGGIVGFHIPIGQVSSYYKGGMPSSEIPRQQKPLPVQRWQIGIQGGTGFMLASSEDMENEFVQAGVNKKTAKDFCKDLKWGYNYGGDIHYMINHWGGVGIKYSGFYSSAGGYLTFDTGDQRTYQCTNMEKRTYTNFIGFSFRTQQYYGHSDKFRITSDIAFGYTHFRDEEEYDNRLTSNYRMKGSSIGGNVEIGIEYSPLNWISVGANIGCFGTWFWKGSISDGYNNTTIKFKDYQLENINASRIDVSIGVKFYL